MYLQSSILRLRAVEPADADLMWLWETDSSQWAENGIRAPFSHNNLKQYAETYDADPIRSGQLRLIVELTPADNETECKAIGLVDLYDIDAVNRTAYTAIYICRDMRGKNYASEALLLLEPYCLQLLNLRILAAKICASNTGSIRLFEQLGYIREGCLSDWMMLGAQTFDLLYYTKHLKC
ncbi:MAG: GNAT family N-acetyltransferase [Muribaculaceae bacterium]|nr:GNAT family N-acetyltransferase [Muribaculaceae bacterium]